MNCLEFAGYSIETEILTMAELETISTDIDKKTKDRIKHYSPIYDSTPGIFDIFRRFIWKDLAENIPHIQFKTDKTEVTA